MKVKRRIVSILVGMLMVFVMMPMVALAADDAYTVYFDSNVPTNAEQPIQIRGKATITAHIVPKPILTITVKNLNYEYNGHIHGPGDMVYEDPAEIAEMITVEGLQDGDTLTSIVVDGQGKDVGTYDLIPSNATVKGVSATDKYDVKYVNGTLTIKKSVTIYTVTFVDGQGNTLKTEEVESGKAATAPEDPQRTGYMFTGWDKNFSKVTTDMTVTAQWKKKAEPAPVTKISGTLLSKLTAKGRNSLVLTWNKVKGADGYDLFSTNVENSLLRK